jgi:hypothetical protein
LRQFQEYQLQQQKKGARTAPAATASGTGN